MLRWSSLALMFIACLSCAAGAAAQEGATPAGSVVTLEGTVEIGRAGTFTAAAVGSQVYTADQIRTGTPGKARIVFVDDSVLNVGDGSLLTIDESVFSPSTGTARLLLRLITGKVRALVSDYYGGSQASYRIETTTAISAVRGTEFVVAYDARQQVTEVLGLSGTVAVHSVLDRKAHGVDITELLLTKVAKGAFPTPPIRVRRGDENYRRLMDGVDFAGAGVPESLAAGDPALVGIESPAAPAPAPAASAPVATPPSPDAGPAGQPARTPGDAIGQPVPVLKGSGGVKIDF